MQKRPFTNIETALTLGDVYNSNRPLQNGFRCCRSSHEIVCELVYKWSSLKTARKKQVHDQVFIVHKHPYVKLLCACFGPKQFFICSYILEKVHQIFIEQHDIFGQNLKIFVHYKFNIFWVYLFEKVRLVHSILPTLFGKRGIFTRSHLLWVFCPLWFIWS